MVPGEGAQVGSGQGHPWEMAIRCLEGSQVLMDLNRRTGFEAGGANPSRTLRNLGKLHLEENHSLTDSSKGRFLALSGSLS